MGKYRRKSVIVDAWQFDGTQRSAEMIHDLSPSISVWPHMNGVGVSIETPDGTMTLQKGDWIIKDSGEYRPCGAEYFAKHYEET